MSDLVSIRTSVQSKAEAMIRTRGDWPCRKGCDDCCRRLASIPLVSRAEWEEILTALNELPSARSEAARARIRESAAAQRPFTCPLLDRESGICLVYAARPVECRTYGFHIERDRVLGCERIEAVAAEGSDLIWGNHETVAAELRTLGPTSPLHTWLENRADSPLT
jgi:Fe-S-cluster containining protein